MIVDPIVLTEDECALIAQARIVEAIKAVRARVGATLQTAYDAVRASPEYAALPLPEEPPTADELGAAMDRLRAILRSPVRRGLVALLVAAADEIEGSWEHIARIDKLSGVSDPDVAGAHADLLMVGSWLARHGERDRANAVRDGVAVFNAQLVKIASAKVKP